MKRVFLWLAMSFVVMPYAQNSGCEIMSQFRNVFGIEKVNYNGNEFLRKYVREVDEENCFASLVNENYYYVDYLLTNFIDRKRYADLEFITDSVQLEEAFVKVLQNDLFFLGEMEKFGARTMNVDSFVPDTVTVDELLDVAVKFFAIIGINEEGHYLGKMCIGINGMKATQKVRKPQIEAFCFNAIFMDYESEEPNIYNEFIEGIRSLYKLNLGIDKDERLLRAQGALYMYMMNNKMLINLLKERYESGKAVLPFVLID